MRILVVDDKTEVLNLLKQSLRIFFKDAQIHTAKRPDEALKLCSELSFDACLIDYKLDDEDGISLAFKIKKINPSSRLAIISAYEEPLGRFNKPYEKWILKSYDLSPLVEFINAAKSHTY